VTDTDLVRAWRSLLERYHSAACDLERALNEEHRLGISEFEVLDHLAESESGTCETSARRVQELADGLHLSQSALSRVIARLERDGLVMRGMCPDDRRGIYVHLTEAGRSKYNGALPTQRAVLAAHFDAAPSARGRAGGRAVEAPTARAPAVALANAKVKAGAKAKAKANANGNTRTKSAPRTRARPVAERQLRNR
jgi:DNA-binding MarR family transcriptional regulator